MLPLLVCLALIGSPDPSSGATGQDAATAAARDYEALYDGGIPFADFLDRAVRRRDTWLRNHEIGEPEPAEVTRARALPEGLRLLVIAEDWCGDSVHTIPYLARLVEAAPNVGLRVIDSDAGSRVMALHPTPDGRPATPTVIVLDAAGGKAGAWVERPTELQTWFLDTEGTVSRNRLFDSKYEWYVEDRGRTTVREIVGLLEAAAGIAPAAPIRLTELASPTSALLQAVSSVNDRVVWVSGHAGTWARSLDGGQSWKVGSVPDGEELQFRDVHAADADTAWLLAAGSGEASRIYRTDDGGDSWRLQFHNREERAFFDCFAFWDRERGIAFSDAVDGRFVILRTDDGGTTWRRLGPEAMPDAQLGEGSFAASGTCAIVGPEGRAWIGTRAADTARVLRSENWGARWRAHETPLLAHRAAGIASLVRLGNGRMLALGGDISAPETPVDGVARSDDDGVTWSLAGRTSGATYGAAVTPDGAGVIAVGPAGIDFSNDLGDRWTRLDERAHWAVAFAAGGRGWAVGPDGRITLLEVTSNATSPMEPPE